jgi:hypothetical protein
LIVPKFVLKLVRLLEGVLTQGGCTVLSHSGCAGVRCEPSLPQLDSVRRTDTLLSGVFCPCISPPSSLLSTRSKLLVTELLGAVGRMGVIQPAARRSE